MGAFALTGVASAADPAPVDESFGYGADHPDFPVWLRGSVIDCAAKTIGIPVEEVKAGLRHGHSLKEIAARHGVRPAALAKGILRCEDVFLTRLAQAGKITREQKVRLMHFLTRHIDEIISYHPHADV
jgi:hypothetical protein